MLNSIQMKIKGRIIFFFSILIIPLSLLIIHKSNGRNKLVNFAYGKIFGNKLVINNSKNISLNDIKLVFKNEYAFASYIGNNFNKTIIDTFYYNGQQLHDIPYDYGKQEIEVIYKIQI